MDYELLQAPTFVKHYNNLRVSNADFVSGAEIGAKECCDLSN